MGLASLRLVLAKGPNVVLAKGPRGAPHPRFPVDLSELREVDAPFLKRKAHTLRCPVPRAGNSGHLARTPDFLPRSARCGHGCGFLLRKGAGSLLERPNSTGNPGFSRDVG